MLWWSTADLYTETISWTNTEEAERKAAELSFADRTLFYTMLSWRESNICWTFDAWSDWHDFCITRELTPDPASLLPVAYVRLGLAKCSTGAAVRRLICLGISTSWTATLGISARVEYWEIKDTATFQKYLGPLFLVRAQNTPSDSRLLNSPLISLIHSDCVWQDRDSPAVSKTPLVLEHAIRMSAMDL